MTSGEHPGGGGRERKFIASRLETLQKGRQTRPEFRKLPPPLWSNNFLLFHSPAAPLGFKTQLSETNLLSFVLCAEFKWGGGRKRSKASNNYNPTHTHTMKAQLRGRPIKFKEESRGEEKDHPLSKLSPPPPRRNLLLKQLQRQGSPCCCS